MKRSTSVGVYRDRCKGVCSLDKLPFCFRPQVGSGVPDVTERAEVSVMLTPQLTQAPPCERLSFSARRHAYVIRYNDIYVVELSHHGFRRKQPGRPKHTFLYTMYLWWYYCCVRLTDFARSTACACAIARSRCAISRSRKITKTKAI